MDKEDYVSLEVAKMLKDKGFDEHTSSYFIIEEYKCIFNGEQFICRVGDIDIDSKLYPEHVLAKRPTLYQAQKWLRGKGINICVANAITVKKPVKWFYTIDLIDNCDGVFPMEYYPSYEEALNNGIRRALKLI